MTTPSKSFEDESEFNGDQVDPESQRPVEQFKDDHAFTEFEDDHKFQRRFHFREDCILRRTFSFGKMKSECPNFLT